MDHGGAHGLVHELVHWASAVILVIGGGVAVVAMAMARRRPPASSPTPSRQVSSVEPPDRSFVVMLAGLSLGAAAIHLVAAPPHYVELGDLGSGFLVAAALQAAWARAIVRGGAGRAIASGLAINGAILLVWIVSRTAGLPIGPASGIPEPVGLPDGASAAFEVLLLVGLTVRAPGPTDASCCGSRRSGRSVPSRWSRSWAWSC